MKSVIAVVRNGSGLGLAAGLDGSIIRDFSNHSITPDESPPRSAHPSNTSFLVLAQPGFGCFAQDFLAYEVDKQTADDAHECDGVHPVNVQMKDLDPNAYPPKVPRQKTDVEEGGTCQTEHNRYRRVEQGQDQSIASQVSANLPTPICSLKLLLVENAGLGPVPDHTPEA